MNEPPKLYHRLLLMIDFCFGIWNGWFLEFALRAIECGLISHLRLQECAGKVNSVVRSEANCYFCCENVQKVWCSVVAEHHT